MGYTTGERSAGAVDGPAGRVGGGVRGMSVSRDGSDHRRVAPPRLFPVEGRRPSPRKSRSSLQCPRARKGGIKDYFRQACFSITTRSDKYAFRRAFVLDGTKKVANSADTDGIFITLGLDYDFSFEDRTRIIGDAIHAAVT